MPVQQHLQPGEQREERVRDVAAKAHRPVVSGALGCVCALVWAVFLGSGVPLGRTTAWFAVLSYVALSVVGRVAFHESLTTPQWAGLTLGLVAIGLLAWVAWLR